MITWCEGPSGCTRRGVGGRQLPPRPGSLVGGMSGQSGPVREDGPALAAFRRCTGEVCSVHASVPLEVHGAQPPWIGHGRSGKPASVPAMLVSCTDRRLIQAKVRTASEVRGEPGATRWKSPVRRSILPAPAPARFAGPCRVCPQTPGVLANRLTPSPHRPTSPRCPHPTRSCATPSAEASITLGA